MHTASMRLRVLFVMIGLIAAGCSEEVSDSGPTTTSDTGAGVDGATTADSTSDTGSTNSDGGSDTNSVCGDGKAEGGEACDEGENNSDALADACRTNCQAASCGDGVIDLRLNETCDDGNRVDDDACNNLCRLSLCGDGVLQPGEACDNGPDNSDTRANACRLNCTLARCGDSATDTDEECDDGNNINTDSCIDCTNARCGDGVIRQNIEACDDSNGSSLDGCSATCRTELGFNCQGEPSVCVTVCGDGSTGGLEACDDGNTNNSDYCSADCANITGFCGDNIVQSNETCDDGNTIPGDGCSNNCTFSGSCGDNIQQPTETCDDGNRLNGDYCSADCASVTGSCGDGTTQINEQCDDGNAIVGDYCSNGCIATGFCGDGVLQTPASEACDDSNDSSGDGCSSLCAREPGWNCSGIPTSCSAILCLVNQRVQNHTCIACASGTSNAMGDDASDSDTLCDVVLCSVNQRVESNLCIACDPGHVNAAGDNATGSNTVCDCGANQRVENNTCIACAPGYVNAAGDDVMGSNTTCDVVICAVNQYVQNHMCVNCLDGWANPSGDNASGANTSCATDVCSQALGVLCSDFEQAYVKSSNPHLSDYFGYSIALSGDTLVVGAIYEDSNATGINGDQSNNSANNSGAVYVFTRSGVTWTQQAYIKASNTGTNDQFGYAVALSGNTLAVSANEEQSNATGVNGNQSNNFGSCGAVYVFTRSGVTWAQQAYIKASNTDGTDYFGDSIALSGDTLAVGAHREASNATGINGDQSNNSASNSGAVYVFTRLGVNWTQQAYIKASNTGAGDYFGDSIALSGDTLAIGAPYEDSNATGVNGDQSNNSITDSGAVYVFTRSGVTWSQQAYIKASNSGFDDQFGYSVALSSDTLAVGANHEDSNATGINGDQSNNSVPDTGAVYVFTRSGTTWTQQAYIKASNTDNLDNFGSSVAISGDTLAVATGSEDSNATGINGDQSNNDASASGAVYMFTRSGVTWAQQAYIKASNTDSGDIFGISVTLSGDTLAVGAIGEDSTATGINGNQANNSEFDVGAVYIRKIAP